MTVGVRRKLIVKDGHGERDVLLVGTVSVGRDPSCDISANDPALSRHHAEFLETAKGILVRDLRSQNGIKVNNVVVREAVLSPGDVVQVAALLLRAYSHGQSAQPAVQEIRREWMQQPTAERTNLPQATHPLETARDNSAHHVPVTT